MSCRGTINPESKSGTGDRIGPLERFYLQDIGVWKSGYDLFVWGEEKELVKF